MKVPLKCPKCDSQVDVYVDTVEEKMDPASVRMVIAGWKHLRGFDHDDKSWDHTYYPILYKPAQSLLKFFDGDAERALDCMQSVFDSFKAKGFEIQSIQGIIKHADKYKQQQQERQAKAQ